MGLIPPVGDPDDAPGSIRAVQQSEQLAAAFGGTFRDHPHAAILEILGPAHEAEFQRPRPCPPPEADTLNLALHPRGEPGLIARGHGLGRGRGWHFGQLNADLFMNGSRRTGVPHRRHGWPARPYTFRERSK